MPVGLGGVTAVTEPARFGDSTASSDPSVLASLWALEVTALSFSGAPSADRPGGNAAGRAPAFLAGTPGWPGPRSWRAFLAA
ncbi:MAG TPA: hypothetical protein VF983_15365 [Streptosporangiaceae bacterium]